MGGMIAVLILAQATTPVVTITPPPRSFDLAAVKPPASRCQDTDFAAADSDVLVCASRPKTPDYRADDDRFAGKPIKPSVDALGGTVDVAAEQRSTLMGSAPAAMVRFKLKF